MTLDRFRANRLASLATVFALLIVGGCASEYAPDSWTGGYSESELPGNTWHVRYGGNGYTTQETVQTYWLYHCAELTLSKGFDGFALVTPVNLAALDWSSGNGDGRARLIKAHSSGGSVRVYTYSYSTTPVNKPVIEGDIKLLKRPFNPIPGKIFDAAAIKSFLEPSVTGPKCNGNICPYVHSYLYPPQP